MPDNGRQWIRFLLDPRRKAEVHLWGFPGRLRIPDRWDTQGVNQNDHLFYWVIEGGFEARLGDEVQNPVAGDLIWVWPGRMFHFRLHAGQQLKVYRFRWKVPDVGRMRASRADGFYPAAWSCQVWMEHLVKEAGRTADRPDERVRGLLLCLLTELERLGNAEADRTVDADGLRPAQQEQLTTYLAGRLRPWPEPADLARHLRLSHDYFTRLFRRSYGMPPRRWLMEQRVHLAAVRLRESVLNVTEVADEFGYRDVFLFSRQFKKVMGVSPMHYRQKQVRDD